MRHLKLFGLFMRLGVVSEMEYRLNFFIHSFEALMMLATGLSVLWVVFSQTRTIAGWGPDQLLLVLGMYFLFYGLTSITVAPSMKQFMKDVWTGNLDYILIKPQNHLFMLSTRKWMIWNLVEICIGLGLSAGALKRLGAAIGFEQALMFALAVACGCAILYAFWIILGTLSFWTTKIENLMLVFYSMYEAGRWPVGLYPNWLRYSLTFLVPVAFAVTFPAEAVLGRLSWGAIALGVGVAIPQLLFARWFFQYGVRKYSGASA